MNNNALASMINGNQVLKQILQPLREGIIIYDAASRFVYMNETAQGLGFTLQDVLGKSVWDIYKEADEFSSVKVLKTGVSSESRIVTFITYQNRRITTITSSHPIFQDNKTIGVIEIFEDISAVNELSEKVAQLQQKNAHNQVASGKCPQAEPHSIANIIGVSDEIKEIKNMIPLLAKSPSPIFIYGETGTGKELIVQAIHAASPQRKAPLIAQNCAAIPEALLEGILFGTVKGGFTGAIDRPGLFELANGGVLFLDEINSMPLPLQAKLLRVLQENKVRRVGGQTEIPIDLHLITATNLHPSNLLKSGDLRLDLYYRINVMFLEIPPLRRRRDDIPLLVDSFISHYNKVFSKQVVAIDKDSMDFFLQYEWPGNIRELKNMIERAMNLVDGSLIHLDDLMPGKFFSGANIHSDQTMSASRGTKRLSDAMRDFEVEYIKEMLIETKGNVSKAARRLDTPQPTLNNKIARYGLRSFVYEQKTTKEN